MKKIKLKISELTNPELLSFETMKSLQGGAECGAGPCIYEGHYGFCGGEDNGGNCLCLVDAGYGPSIDCWAR